MVHWATWLGCTFGLASISFILAEAIPIFNYLIALTGSICFAPLAMMLPGWLWAYDHPHYRRGTALQKIIYGLHMFLIALGAFFLVAGTYGVVLEIKEAYATGLIGTSTLMIMLVLDKMLTAANRVRFLLRRQLGFLVDS